MRSLFVLGAMAVLACTAREAAAQGAWCAEDMNMRNCGFYTLQQCQAAASGLGAGCYPNQFVARAPAVEPQKRPKRKKQDR
ncbi:MAG TPA: DUF3551 domain-containing protein [Xanthobacteraceae bacterium]|nr:DUF3551 domain-containing protein [Xanthobacteraceae bacterium]